MNTWHDVGHDISSTQKGLRAERTHFDSPYWHHVYNTHVVGVYCVSSFIHDSVMSLFLA